ncbi:MAG: DUF177 domain-containing protein [Anaerolineaceae bacterium]|nr:DUF177 domain-containing protein [Anaerolineaceae bacterium]
MEKKLYSLRTNIGYFLNKPIGFSKDFKVEYPEIYIEPDLNILNFISDSRFSRTREGLLLQSEIGGEIKVNCSRCLSPFFVHVNSEFEELFVFIQRSQEISDLIVPEDGYIDLGGLFREYMLLEIPINSICQEDCKGLCVECGQNLNEEFCEHYL